MSRKRKLSKDLISLRKRLEKTEVMAEILENQKRAFEESQSIRDMTKIPFEALHRKYN